MKATFLIPLILAIFSCKKEEKPVPVVPDDPIARAKADQHQKGPKGTRSGGGRAKQGGGGMSVDLPSSQPPLVNLTGTAPPVYLTYVVHVQAANVSPYSDPGLNNLDIKAADNFIATIEAIAGVANKHGMKITWTMMEQMSKAIYERQGTNNIIKKLASQGHEIGVHVLKPERLSQSVAAVKELGLKPTVMSGFLVQVGKQNPAAKAQLVVDGALNAGIKVLTTNLAPGDKLAEVFYPVCNGRYGNNNNLYETTGNLHHPWKPSKNSFCNDDPKGDVTIVDHTSSNWLVTNNGKVDLVGEQQFWVLEKQLSGLIEYIQSNKPTQVSTWGYATHLNEYQIGESGENTVDQSAISQFDRFLSVVDHYVKNGRVVYATASEVAEANN